VSVPSSELGPPPPSPQTNIFLLGPKGGGSNTHPLKAVGVGGPIRTTGEKLSTLSTLWCGVLGVQCTSQSAYTRHKLKLELYHMTCVFSLYLFFPLKVLIV
jgi:hypothetical protein